MAIASLRAASIFVLIVLAGNDAPADIIGFNGGIGWQNNQGGSGSASFSQQTLTITTVNIKGACNTVFYQTQQTTSEFIANFTYTDTANGQNGGDGATFTIQNDPRGASAVPEGGGRGLGYGDFEPITNSVAVELHIDPVAFPPVGTGLGVNGSYGTYATTGGVNIRNGDPINVTLSYDGTTLMELLVDSVTLASYSTSYTIDLPSVVGTLAYVGITGADGADTATQKFTNFSYVTPEPASWVMFALGGIGLWCVARSRRRAARAIAAC